MELEFKKWFERDLHSMLNVEIPYKKEKMPIKRKKFKSPAKEILVEPETVSNAEMGAAIR